MAIVVSPAPQKLEFALAYPKKSSEPSTTEVGVCAGLSKKIVRALHHRSWSLLWLIQKIRQSPAPQKLEFALVYPKKSSEPCTTEVGVCSGLSKKIVRALHHRNWSLRWFIHEGRLYSRTSEVGDFSGLSKKNVSITCVSPPRG